MDMTADVLSYLREKGVRLWSENGQLRYKAPKGALTQEEIGGLRVYKAKIVALLERSCGADASDLRRERRPRVERAPVAFSQLAHWNCFQLSARRSLSLITSAIRMHGRLNIDVLRKSAAEIVRRHDALRTQIVVFDGIPTQEIAESRDCELKVDDLTAFSETDRETEIKHRIENHILEPIDVAVDPLFRVRLLRLSDEENVLVVAMEHLISDASSMNNLLRELFTAYTQALKGRAFSLPAIPVQFTDYAVWQRNSQKYWIEKHGAYWSERLRGCGRLRFPLDKSLPAVSCLGWGTIPLQISRDLKSELSEWCRLRRTTLVMSIFTAYVALVLCWCGVSEGVILYQSDGRTSPKIAGTIGYFAFPLYLRIELREDDRFVDLLNRVTEEYCKAYEHADSCYMEAQVPQPEFTKGSCFNCVTQDSKIEFSDLGGSEDAITCTPVTFEHPIIKNLELDIEPLIGLTETDDAIVGGVGFPLNRFSFDTMERFGRNFLVFITALLRQPEKPVKGISLL